MKSARTLLCCTLFLALTGCGSAFRVHQGTKAVAGIPFYVKTAKCLHQTVYMAPYYTITFQMLLKDDKVLGSDGVAITEETFKDADTLHFLEIMRDEPKKDTFDEATRAWDALKQRGINPYDPKALQLRAVRNTSTATVMVDYTEGHEYTLNAKVPLAGSVTATYKLSSDGTLTDVSTIVEDKTFATIAGLFPVSDLIKTAANVTKQGFLTGRITLQVKVERHAIKATYSKVEPFTLGCDAPGNLDPAATPAFTVEDVGPEEGGGAKQKSEKPDANTIQITGAIRLPKPADSNTPATGQPDQKDDSNQPAKAPGSQPATPTKSPNQS